MSGARVRDLEASGRRIGHSLATGEEKPNAGEQLLFDTLTSLGFQPERASAGSGRMTYRLRNCPYREAVHERQPLVCALHRGLTAGLVESIDPDNKLAGFEPKDPDLAGCLMHVRGPITRHVPPAEDTV